MNEEGNLKIDFSFTNEFGQESRVIKTYTPYVLQDQTCFDFLVEEFKMFMSAAGFTNVDKITVIED
jgi:hypothetical protein